MPTPPLTDEQLRETVKAWRENNRNVTHTALALSIDRRSVPHRLKRAAERGLLLDQWPAIPGFRVSQVTDTPHGQFIQQKPERGEQFEVPAGHVVKGISALVAEDGRKILEWIKTDQDRTQQA